MSKAIIMIGAPGSGKGTQSNLIADKLSLLTYCMGDIVRSEMSSKTELGLKMKSYINNGDLVPDELIIDIFKSNFSKNDNHNGFISDGFPRTITQAKVLDDILNSNNLQTLIVHLVVDNDLLVDRLLARKRFDDTKDVIQNRLSTYNNEVSDIISYYGDRVNTIDSNGTVDGIFNNILNIVNNA